MIEPSHLKLQKKEHNRRYKAAHRDETSASGRKYYQANMKKIKEYASRWGAANRDKKKENGRKSYMANREKVSAGWHRTNLKRFGLTPTDYATMLVSQHGVCAICRKPCKTGRRLAVDHCHATGVVRGLLCHGCNLTIGRHFDSPERLEALLKYVRKHSQLRLVVRK